MNDVKIGLEIHVQLVSLKTKLFCSCSADYRGKPPNTNVCPVCMGLPGTLPVLNEKAIEEAIKVAKALSANISNVSYFFRKNYFYPDLAKNFQITQYDKAGGIPFATGGYLKLSNGRKIRIRRMQLEEDPGRIYYETGIQEARYSLIDYNRHGVALIEIVTEPDIREPKEAREFLEKLSGILEELGIPVGEYEGAIRCDANISLREGTRVEVKNITGFSAVEKALSYEITRQRNLIKRGIKVERETRHWDERRRITTSLRKKEMEEDYRYFPEPDLPPLTIGREVLERIEGIIKPIEEIVRDYVKKYGVEEVVAERIARDRRLRALFDRGVKDRPDLARHLASLLANEVPFLIKRREIELPNDTKGLLIVAEAKRDGLGRDEILRLLDNWLHGRKVIYRKVAVLKEADLEDIVRKVIEGNPKVVEDAKKNPKALNYLMGLALKEAKGIIDKKKLFDLLRKSLGL